MESFEGKGRQRSTRGRCQTCAQRRLGGAEIYELRGDGGISLFDVGRAKEIAADGRSAEAIPRPELEKIVHANQIDALHLRHVRFGTPGIIGQRHQGRFLLDGAHRASRSLSEGAAFSAYVLSLEETRSCLLSQDVWESDFGLAALELRRLLQNNPDSDIEIEVSWSLESIHQVRGLLTPAENARLKIRRIHAK